MTDKKMASRIDALEARVKALEEARHPKPAAPEPDRGNEPDYPPFDPREPFKPQKPGDI